MHVQIVRVLLAVLLVAGRACTDGESESTTSASVEAAAGLTTASVSYTLDWSLDGLTRSDDGASWTTTTDQGYQVSVTSGYLVSYSTSLVSCEDLTTARLERPARSFLDRLFAPASARAGHPEDEEPSMVSAPQVESLTALQSLAFGERTFDTTDYCMAHYVVGMLTPTSVDADAFADLIGSSLVLEGTWTSPDGATTETFSITTDMANGQLETLSDVLTNPLSDGQDALTVTVSRQPARWFDGIEFATGTIEATWTGADPFARQVVVNMMDSLTITAEGQ